jgi:hypothetical protein
MYESQHYVYGKFVVKVPDDDYGTIETVRWAIVHKGGALKRRRAKSIAQRLRRGWEPVAVFAEMPLYPEAMMRGLDEEEQQRIHQQARRAVGLPP